MSRKIKVAQPEWVRYQMEERVFSKGDEAHSLAQALYYCATCFPQHRKEAKLQVAERLQCICKGSPYQARTFQELIQNGIFEEALFLLFGNEEAGSLKRLLLLRMNGPVAETVFRTPFHSTYAGDYLDGIFLPTIYRWICGTGCPVTVKDCLIRTDLILPREYDFSNRLALALYEGDEEVYHAVEAMLQREEKEQQSLISRDIFQGIIRSDHAPSIDCMKQLMTAQYLPPKQKDDLLSVLDEGSFDTFLDFLKLIYEEQLYRSPVAASIVDNWLWLGFGALEPEMAQMVLKNSLQLFHHPEFCQMDFISEDMMTVHIALWTMAVKNIRAVRPLLSDMLRSQDKKKMISAIYFINNVEHQYLDCSATIELLEKTEDPELLAWLIPNLMPWDLEERLPGSAQERQKRFSLLERLLRLIGKEEITFSGKPFPWTIKRLSPQIVAECMLRMAAACEDRSMIRSIGRFLEYLTPKQRGFYYEHLLDPIHWREDYCFLMDHMGDRSLKNRQLIEQRLGQTKEW